MSAMTNTFEGNIGRLVLNGIAYVPTVSGTVYLALFSGGVTSATWGEALTSGTSVEGEVATGSTNYARVPVVSGWTHGPGSGVFSNTSEIEFPIASGAGWGTVSGFALFATLASGEALIYGSVTTPKTVVSGDSAAFQPGQLVINWQ